MLELLLIVHVAVAILVTIVIYRLDYFERPQAIGQTLVAWCIPVIGPVLILIFQSVVRTNMKTKVKPDSDNPYRDEGLAVDLYHEVKSDD